MATSRRDGSFVKPVGGGAGGAVVTWDVLKRRRAWRTCLSEERQLAQTHGDNAKTDMEKVTVDNKSSSPERDFQKMTYRDGDSSVIYIPIA